MLFERWDIKPDLIIQKNIEPIAKKIKDFLKEFYETNNVDRERYIMLNDYRIMSTYKYLNFYIALDKNDPRNALVYIYMASASTNVEFYFPFIYYYGLIIDVYLSKQGFFYYDDYEDKAVPATGLKYISFARYKEGKAIIEIFDIYEIFNKVNIPMEDNDYNVFLNLFESQRIFAGYNVREALKILNDYYSINVYKNKDDVDRIIADYNKIFTPLYRACYNTRSWDRIDCTK